MEQKTIKIDFPITEQRQVISAGASAIDSKQKIKSCFMGGVFVLAFCHTVPALSESKAKKIHFDIPSKNLASALLAYSETTDVQLSYPQALVKDVKSERLSGEYTPEQALQKLLANSHIAYKFVGNDAITLAEAPKEITTNTLAEVPKENKSSIPGETTLKPMTVVGTVENDPVESDPDDPYNSSYNRTKASTATKTDTPIMETPFSVKVISKQIMQDQQSVRMDQALENISGVQPSRSAAGLGGSQSSTFIRGFQSYNFYRDGGYIPNGWLTNGPREMANRLVAMYCQPLTY